MTADKGPSWLSWIARKRYYVVSAETLDELHDKVHSVLESGNGWQLAGGVLHTSTGIGPLFYQALWRPKESA